MPLPKVSIIGTGYVGLVTGACLAELGVEVTCIDNNISKINSLKEGKIPFFEPNLDKIVTNQYKTKRLNFALSIEEGVKEADIVFIAVGTPANEVDGSSDLQYVHAAARELAAHVKDDCIIVTKSTVPVGTGAEIKEQIHKTNPNLKFHVASNPEFLREGSAVEDFMKPDRIVIGTESDFARQKLEALYTPLTNQGVRLVATSIQTSELIKYAANAYLAMRIAFLNEMADLCESAGGDIEELALGIGLDKRIGTHYLKPGPGYGGSCFPKDTKALLYTSRELKAESGITKAVIDSNDARKKRMAEKIIKACGGSVKGKTLALLGLAFKADTDDMRDAASLFILPPLIEAGAEIRAYDPQAMEQAKAYFKDSIAYAASVEEALKEADAAVILTEWSEFKEADFSVLKNKSIIDLRNLFNPAIMKTKGYAYHSIGRAH